MLHLIDFVSLTEYGGWKKMYGDKHAHRHTHEHRHTREHANTQMLAVMDILVRSILHMSGK